MASIWKNPRSKYFIACFTDGKGRRLKRSTKTTDKKQAMKLATKFEEESVAKRTAKQARQVLSDIYKSLSGEEAASKTVQDFFASFIEGKKLEVGPASLDYYKGHAKRFAAWLGPRADVDIAEITKSEITAYRNAVAGHAGTRTTNNTLKAVKAFFSAARKEGLLIEDPAADVDGIKDRSESNRRPFTLEELRLVVAEANEEWKSMIRFGFYTGQRLSDIATLTWENIDTKKNKIRLVTRKTGRHQNLPLPASLVEHIAGMVAPDDPRAPLHPKAAGLIKAQGRAAPLSKAFAGILEAAGLRTEKDGQKTGARMSYELSFHSLRHTATSILKEAGIPQSVVMDFIGHDSADVSAGYTHTGEEALVKAAAAFPAL
jgi:integrase